MLVFHIRPVRKRNVGAQSNDKVGYHRIMIKLEVARVIVHVLCDLDWVIEGGWLGHDDPSMMRNIKRAQTGSHEVSGLDGDLERLVCVRIWCPY